MSVMLYGPTKFDRIFSTLTYLLEHDEYQHIIYYTLGIARNNKPALATYSKDLYRANILSYTGRYSSVKYSEYKDKDYQPTKTKHPYDLVAISKLFSSIAYQMEGVTENLKLIKKLNKLIARVNSSIVVNLDRYDQADEW
jgi:hypothetical protein